MRSALGASRVRLIRQTLTEALLLALAGSISGCAVAEVLLRVLMAIAPTGIPMLAKGRLDLRMMLFALSVSALCAIVFGVLAATETPGPAALVARATKSGRHARLRRVLVAAQIAISVVLLSSAGLLLRSFLNLQKQNIGMQTQNVLTERVPLNWERYPKGYLDFYLRTESAFRSLPGVSAVGMSNSLPPDGEIWHGGMRSAEIFVVGKPPHPQGSGGTVVVRAVTPDYFRALQFPILRGPGFTEQERTSTANFLVLSQSLASRLFTQQDPIGRYIEFGVFDPYFKADPTVLTIVAWPPT